MLPESRGTWRVRTEAHAEMTATASELRLSARLRAYEGDDLVFERLFDDAVPRRFV